MGSTKTAITGYQDRVVTINGRHFPAWGKPEGTLVDLRLFGAGDELTYQPDELRKAGVPERMIEAAAQSAPPGFLLLTS